jgi:hypothetical protein
LRSMKREKFQGRCLKWGLVEKSDYTALGSERAFTRSRELRVPFPMA